MNNTKYIDWLKVLPTDDLRYDECACPECGSLGLKYQYFGLKKIGFGWKLIWCDACKSAVNISRAKIPEGVNCLVDGYEQAEFNAQHSYLRLIS
ncbi:hypothetical protein [Massilia sp. BJB1822]|uniref:hypothetical protein n=1 Tax=Massilia sp. BJB1822 TaxID=2744470 RepID=UPI0015937C83|nr:hypothetical protein [Massilia sp. BJB1822]NVE01680.1 hypothetical protein [Massilia sp. BJB1822]